MEIHNQPKEKVLTFKVSQSEQLKIESNREKAHTSLSEYLRNAALQTTVHVIDNADRMASSLCALQEELLRAGQGENALIREEMQKLWLCLKK